jgi:hypothetical protein
VDTIRLVTRDQFKTGLESSGAVFDEREFEIILSKVCGPLHM